MGIGIQRNDVTDSVCKETPKNKLGLRL